MLHTMASDPAFNQYGRDDGHVMLHTMASDPAFNQYGTDDDETDGSCRRSSLVIGVDRPTHRWKHGSCIAQEEGEAGENYLEALARQQQLDFSFCDQYQCLPVCDRQGIVKDTCGKVLLIVGTAFDIVVNIDGLKDKADARNYSARRATFYRKPQRWPRAKPTPEDLAEFGFMYLGQEERVHCFSCGLVISHWEQIRDPLREHFTKNSMCTFIRENFAEQVRQFERERPPGDHSAKFANSSARLHSFSAWPLGHLATSYQLASVGFFFTGIGTRVQCFSCGLKYQDWKKGDIPLLIHRKLSPLCRFLNTLISKGTSPSPTPVPPSGSPTPPPPFQSKTPLLSLHHRDEVSTPPDWANEFVRKQSFKHMAQQVPVLSDDCARAGLYFIRKPDVMRCFSCDVMLKKWVDGDVPVEKHRGANPHCKYLLEFFPTKLEQRSSDDEGFDPSSLPEPIYVPHSSPKSPSPVSPLYSGLSRLHMEPQFPSYSSQYSPQLSLSSHRTTPSYTREQQSPSYSTSALPSQYASQHPSLLHPSDHHYSRLTPSYHGSSSAGSNQSASPAGSVRQYSPASSYNYDPLSAGRPQSVRSTTGSQYVGPSGSQYADLMGSQYVGPSGSQYSGPISDQYIATPTSHQPRDELVSYPSFGPSSSSLHPSSVQVIPEEPLFYMSQGRHVRLPPSYHQALHRTPLSLPSERTKMNPVQLPQNYTVCIPNKAHLVICQTCVITLCVPPSP